MIDLNEYLYVPLWLLLVSGFTSGVVETVVGALIGVFTVGRRREKQWKKDIATTAEAGADIADQKISLKLKELREYVDSKLDNIKNDLSDQEITLSDAEVQRIIDRFAMRDEETGNITPLNKLLYDIQKEIRTTRMTFLSKKGVKAREDLSEIGDEIAQAQGNGGSIAVDPEMYFVAKRLFHASDRDIATFASIAAKRGWIQGASQQLTGQTPFMPQGQTPPLPR